MNEYPRMLYRHPSIEGGTVLQDGAYDTLIVPDAEKHDTATGDGWCTTPAEALEASPDKPSAPSRKKKA